MGSRTYMEDAMNPTESLARSGDFTYGCLESYKGEKFLIYTYYYEYKIHIIKYFSYVIYLYKLISKNIIHNYNCSRFSSKYIGTIR